jgi:hypothetical protein
MTTLTKTRQERIREVNYRWVKSKKLKPGMSAHALEPSTWVFET